MKRTKVLTLQAHQLASATKRAIPAERRYDGTPFHQPTLKSSNPILQHSGERIMDTRPSPTPPSSPHSYTSEYPLNGFARILLAMWGVLLSLVFATALWLDPNPRGFGTHQGLGLPPCTFRENFEVPCPSCGFTTSFSHFVRGQWLQSARVNLAGLGLAILCAVQIPWAFFSSYQGRMFRVSNPDQVFLWVLVGTTLGMLLVWLIRIFI